MDEEVEHRVYVGNSDLRDFMSEEDRREADFAGGPTSYSDRITVEIFGDLHGLEASQSVREAMLGAANKLYDAIGGRFNVYIKIKKSLDREPPQ